MPISSRSVVSTTVLFLVIGFLALLGVLGATLWLGERTQNYFEQVIEARNQRASAVDLRAALSAAESAERGYVASDNEIYLAPYEVARSQTLRLLGEIQRAYGPYPEHAAGTARLVEIAAAKFAEMDQVIALQRSGHGNDALEMFQTNKGKALMDEANVFFSGLLDGAEARQNAGVEGQRVTATWQRLASIAGTIIIIAVVIAAIMVLTRYTRELRRVSDEVTSLNSDLEQRVQDRTQDLVTARDRATALLSEVNHRVANSLTLVSSLVGMQSRAVSDAMAKSALAETQDRIFAISLVHKRLYASGEVGVVQLDDYLSGLLDHLRTSLRGGNDVSLTYHIAPVALATDRSINLGVILTEWVTNAYKYAYPDGSGEVRVSLRALDGGLLQMIVEDDGVGSVDGAPAQGTGVGTRIVKAMAVSMEGRVENLPRDRGTAVSLTVPHKT